MRLCKFFTQVSYWSACVYAVLAVVWMRGSEFSVYIIVSPQRLQPRTAPISVHHLGGVQGTCQRTLTRSAAHSHSPRNEDDAVARLEKNANGKMVVTRVLLRPRVIFGSDNKTDRKRDATQVAELHKKAHHNCFISNSIQSQVEITPVLT